MRNTAIKDKSMREVNVGGQFFSLIWNFGAGTQSKNHFVDVALVVAGDSLEVLGGVAALPDGPVHFHLQRSSAVARQFRPGERLASQYMRNIKALAVDG